MAPHAYQSLEPGEQVVISDEPREDLEELARWVSIPVPEAPEPEKPVEIPDGEPTEKWSVAELKAYAAREEIDLGSAKNKPEYFKVIGDAVVAKAAAEATAAEVAAKAAALLSGSGTE